MVTVSAEGRQSEPLGVSEACVGSERSATYGDQPGGAERVAQAEPQDQEHHGHNDTSSGGLLGTVSAIKRAEETDRPGFQPRHCPLVPMQPWASNLTSVSLNALLRK